MEKKLLVLGMAAMMAAGAANAELQAFKVNGETVSVAQQKALYDSAVAQGQPAGAELERQVKNVLTQQTVLLQEAKKAKLDRNSDVKQAIEAARNQVLINAVMRDWAKKNPVKDEDVRKAYEAEKAAYGRPNTRSATSSSRPKTRPRTSSAASTRAPTSTSSPRNSPKTAATRIAAASSAGSFPAPSFRPSATPSPA